MSKYYLLFIDEEEESLENFQYYIYEKDNSKEVDLEAMIPYDQLDDLLEYINENNFDAIITDHKLNEKKSSIEYDGIDLVKAILQKKEGFPCFILTGWDKDAVENGDDANIVYLKNFEDPDGDTHATFLDKIKNQIIHYRTKIKNAESELLQLIEKSKREELNAKEESRLVYLDNFISSSLDKESQIPEQLKGYKNLQELHKMIENTDCLIEKLKGLTDE